MTRSKSGFTMIELLVVTTIMIILTMVGLVSYQSAMRKARNGKRHADLETVRSALVMFRTDNTGYPDGNFANMLADLSTYLSTSEVEDPKNTGVYVYTYTPATCSGGFCRTFELCAYEEPDPGVQFCIRNP